MYDIISDILQHTYVEGLLEQPYVYQICGCLIVIVFVVFIDLIYRLLSHFWR